MNLREVHLSPFFVAFLQKVHMEEQQLLSPCEMTALAEFRANAQLFVTTGEHTGAIVALYPTPETAEPLAAVPGVTVPAADLHLTLAYLGEVATLSDAQLAATLLIVRRLAEQALPLTGTVQGVGRFNASERSGGRDVIYAVPNLPQLPALHHELMMALRDRGTPLLPPGFMPHITLGYVEPGSEFPMSTVPTLPLHCTALSLVVGDQRLDFPLGALATNAAPCGCCAETLAATTEEPVANTEEPVANTEAPVESGVVQLAVNAQVTVKEIIHNGRAYLVAPSVPIREGVLNGELVPAAEIQKFALAWNGRPMPLGHPKDNGGFISANSPDLWDSTPAFFFNAQAEDGVLRGEVWLDIEKAEALGGLAVQALNRLRHGQPLELSTAYFRDLDPQPGTYAGKSYRGVARNLRPDHIAILLNEPGACSWQDGCGAPRVNSAQDQVQASQTFLSAIVRNVIRSLVPGGKKVDREALIASLVANSACKCSAEQLAAVDEGTLQAFVASLTPVAAPEVAPIANARVETPAPQQPVAVPLPQEVVAFTEMVAKFGGMDKLTAALDGVVANADRERGDLITALVANERCTLSKGELAGLAVDSLRKLQAAFAPRNYAANAGALVSNTLTSEDEFRVLAMPTAFKESK